MTHDELLAKIEARFEEDNHHLLKDALRAVVELHKPFENLGFIQCVSCIATPYPCPTIQAIEKELE